MDITVRVEVQYVAPEHALIRDVLQMFRTPAWVRFMVRYISPHLKNAAPADKSVVESLESWKLHSSSSSAAIVTSSSTATAAADTAAAVADTHSPCVICMSDVCSTTTTATHENSSSDAVQLPCGHCFHHGCIQSWLKLRSTCPSCRFQFRKAFSGSYAVKTLNSALLLKPEHRYLAKEDILNTGVGKETVRAVVNVTLSQIASATKRSQYPCVLNALMMHSNGDSFSEVVAVDKSAVDSAAPARAVDAFSPASSPSASPASSPSSSAASGVGMVHTAAAVASASSSSSSSAFEHEDGRRSKRVRVH